MRPNNSNVWRAYYELTKPRVVLLMLLTALVGMLLATPALPPLNLIFFGLLGIGFSASGAAVINHLVDERYDAGMQRTANRPIPSGKVNARQALIFALLLSVIGLGSLIIFVNWLTALLTFLSLIGYAVVYTIFLKHATPQNIVIGGIAGAMPPLLGWCAITNSIDPNALLLVLIIFVWTPPHFWALAIHRQKEYRNVAIPMLPVTHGVQYTKLSVLLYTILLVPVSLLPFVFSMSGKIYFYSTFLLDLGFLYWAIKLALGKHPANAVKTFRYSIWYLMILFVVLLADHYL
jgi:protoheme IX farnesyltransferase